MNINDRPPCEVAEVIRRYRVDFLQTHGPLPPEKHYVLHCLSSCRTQRLGGHRRECPACGYAEQSYNSCRNRHCPKCQAASRAAWLEARRSELLPVEYFHVVFTLPRCLAALALQNQRLLYNLLFEAASETLLEVAAQDRYLGAKIGFLAVLHTWGQSLQDHPHLHCIVPGGGLSKDDSRWISCPRGFFLPVRVLSRVYRAKFLKKLKQAYRQGTLEFHGRVEKLKQPDVFGALLDQAYQTEWVVYAKPPFGGPEQVLKYLARYTHRVAISNRRLQSVEDGKVTFRWKNYAKGNRLRSMTLSASEFLRRFLLHVLPKRFVKIRQYGLLANRHRKQKLARCRQLLAETSAEERLPEPTSCQPANRAESAALFQRRCPQCGQGILEREETIAWRRYTAWLHGM